MFAPKVQARGHHALMPFPSFQNIDVALETCFKNGRDNFCDLTQTFERICLYTKK